MASGGVGGGIQIRYGGGSGTGTCQSNPAVNKGHPDCHDAATQQPASQGGGGGGGSLAEQSYQAYLRGEKKNIPAGMSFQQYQGTYFGGGGGGGGGSVSTTGTTQMPYNTSAPGVRGISNELKTYGEGLMDPNSDYSQRLREQMVQGIGQQTGAAQRGAVLNAARAGYGTGAGADLLETQGDISRGGLEAQGQASANLALQAPQLATQFMNPALNAELGLQSNDLQAWLNQQNIGAQQSAQQAQVQLQQQQMANEAALQQAQFKAQQQMAAQLKMQQQQMQQDAMNRQLALMYSGY